MYLGVKRVPPPRWGLQSPALPVIPEASYGETNMTPTHKLPIADKVR